MTLTSLRSGRSTVNVAHSCSQPLSEAGFRVDFSDAGLYLGLPDQNPMQTVEWLAPTRESWPPQATSMWPGRTPACGIALTASDERVHTAAQRLLADQLAANVLICDRCI